MNSLLTLLPVYQIGLWSAVLIIGLPLVQFVVMEVRRRRLFARRVLILGSGRLAVALVSEIESRRSQRYVVAGLVDDVPPVDPADAERWAGPSDRLSEIVRRIRPSEIIVAVDDRRDHLPLRSLLDSRVRGTIVEDGLEFYERLTGKMAIEALTPGSLILGSGFRNRRFSRTLARGLSLAGAAVGLVVVAPLLALAALAIKLDSRGPIFFIQARSGSDGRPFSLLKLRTMHACTDSSSEWAQDNAHRITRVGKWLRRFRIDELPQLLNVLRGDMNLIGPRPHPVRNQAIFLEHIRYYGLRSSVPPGITGWAQVRYGYANNLGEETEKMRYDLYYIKHRSLWLDLRIAVATAGMVLLGRGSTGVKQSPNRQLTWRPFMSGRRTASGRFQVGSSPARGRS
jgi:exopolysaccharide biosynthesis polyprenyl glycosylphosphotransferase